MKERRGKLRRTVKGAYAVLSSFFVLTIACLGWGINALNRNSDAIRNSQEILYSSKSLVKSMVDMETGARGYVLYNNKELFKPYEEAREVFTATADKAIEITEGNPQQQNRFKESKRLCEEWYQEAEVALGRLTQKDFYDYLQDSSRKRTLLIEQIRGQSDIIEAEETERIASLIKDSDSKRASLGWFIFCCTFSSVSFSFITAKSLGEKIDNLNDINRALENQVKAIRNI